LRQRVDETDGDVVTIDVVAPYCCLSARGHDIGGRGARRSVNPNAKGAAKFSPSCWEKQSSSMAVCLDGRSHDPFEDMLGVLVDFLVALCQAAPSFPGVSRPCGKRDRRNFLCSELHGRQSPIRKKRAADRQPSASTLFTRHVERSKNSNHARRASRAWTSGCGI
jgi:hypothetical protein